MWSKGRNYHRQTKVVVREEFEPSATRPELNTLKLLKPDHIYHFFRRTLRSLTKESLGLRKNLEKPHKSVMLIGWRSAKNLASSKCDTRVNTLFVFFGSNVKCRFKLKPEHLTRNCFSLLLLNPIVPIQLKRIIRLYCLLRARGKISGEFGYDRAKLYLIVHFLGFARLCF